MTGILEKWQTRARTLNELADVNASSPSNGNSLIFNSDTNNWESGAPSGGGLKNLLINGDMGIWQRGTSFVQSGGYTADRWKVGGTLVSKTITRTTDVPSNTQFAYSLRIQRDPSDTGTAIGIGQGYELPAAGKPGVFVDGHEFVFSFYAKAIGTSDFIGTTIGFNDGVGDALNLVPAATATVTPVSMGQWHYYEVPIVISGTPNPANICAQCNVNFGPGITDFYVTGIQLERGSVATPFEYRNPSLELMMCQRYYEKSYNIDLDPGTNTSRGSVSFEEIAMSVVAHNVQVNYKTTKRTNPTVVVYAPESGTPNTISGSGLDLSVDTVDSSHTGIQTISLVNVAPDHGTNQQYFFQYTSDAEL